MDNFEQQTAIDLEIKAIELAEKEGRKLDIARHLEMLSLTYMKQGDYSEAEAACTRALSTREEELGSENLYLTMPLSVLCQIKEQKGNFEDAVTYCERAIVIKKKWYGEEHPSVANSYFYIALLYKAQGMRKESHKLFKQALCIRKNIFEPGHPDRLVSIDSVYPRFIAFILKFVEFVRAIRKSSKTT